VTEGAPAERAEPAVAAGRPKAQGRRGRSDVLRRAGWVGLALGAPGLLAAALADPHDVAGAASQDWPPFVLVTGLLALGLVARDDGLFHAAGARMAAMARGGRSLLVASAVLVALVTAVLNLDTSVAFLTPVLVVAARRRTTDETPFLYLAVFLSNGASLLLPGSNLTNLIVLGTVHSSGSAFVSAMALPWLAAVVAVSAVVAVAWRRSLGRAGARVDEAVPVRLGVGLAGVGAAVVAMLTLSPAGEAIVAVAAGVVATGWSLGRRRLTLDEVDQTLNLPMVAGLFTVAVCLGTLGRAWSGPSHFLAHASSLLSAVLGAGASVLVNNLPAASLLAARPPAHAYALLIGLNLGPNLAVTGALSALLWLQVSRTVGARPSAWRYSVLGVVVVPVSMALALLALTVTR
jgi:arsenical pump membrane protein